MGLRQQNIQMYENGYLDAFLREQFSNKAIAFEGLIGIGKSTLCKKIKHVFGEKALLLEENIPEKFLELFYSDPNLYGFPLQIRQQQLRKHQKTMLEYSKQHENKFVLWDRSIVGDYIFTMCNYMLGSISEQELNVYLSELKGDWVEELKHLDYVVFLYDDPEECKRRVEDERGHPSERAIPLSYYEALDQVHFSVMLELLEDPPAKMYFFPWGRYHRAQDVLENIFHYFTSPTITWKEKGEDLENAEWQDRVVLNARANQLSAEEACIEKECYVRPFYNKKFRKEVLKYLTRGCDIILY